MQPAALPRTLINRLEAMRSWLSIAEVADMFKVSHDTIERLCRSRDKAKSLPARKILGSWRIDPHALAYQLRSGHPSSALAARAEAIALAQENQPKPCAPASTNERSRSLPISASAM
jgi:hypothetical protein